MSTCPSFLRPLDLCIPSPLLTYSWDLISTGHIPFLLDLVGFMLLTQWCKGGWVTRALASSAHLEGGTRTAAAGAGSECCHPEHRPGNLCFCTNPTLTLLAKVYLRQDFQKHSALSSLFLSSLASTRWIRPAPTASETPTLVCSIFLHLLFGFILLVQYKHSICNDIIDYIKLCSEHNVCHFKYWSEK